MRNLSVLRERPKSNNVHVQATLATSTQHSLARPTEALPTFGPPTMTMSFFIHKPLTTPTAVPTAAACMSHTFQKQAIIGGLSGAIGGLMLIGLLISFCPSGDESETTTRSPYTRKALVRQSPGNGANLRWRDSPGEPRSLAATLSKWPNQPRIAGPRRLQVMNPSPSRPSTPVTCGSSDFVPKFLRRQKTALADMLSISPRSRAKSTGESTHRALTVPAIAIDPALSTINATSGADKNAVLTIATVKDTCIGMGEETDWFSTKVTTIYIKQDSFAYPACSSEGCNKKKTCHMQQTV